MSKWGSYCSVTKSCLTLCDPHGPQHTRLPCPLLSLKVCSNSCLLSQWCPPTISPSVAPFSSYPQFFPASGSFPKSWLFASGGQSVGASASASVLSMNIQGWFHLGLTGLLSLQSKGLWRVFSNTTVPKHQFLSKHSAFFIAQLSHLCITTGKTRRQVLSLLFSAISRFVIAFLPRSKHLLNSWLQ